MMPPLLEKAAGPDSDWCLKRAIAIAPQDLQQAIRAVPHGASDVEQAVAIVIGDGHVQRREVSSI